jgi:branched-chain amino acid transport system permease protein
MTTFLQLTAGGLALGFLYALVGLSFVVIVKATGHFNLLPGSFVLVGAYMTYQMHVIVGLDFFLATLVTIVFVAILGILIQRFIFDRIEKIATQAAAGLAILLVSMGLLSIATAVVVSAWGADTLNNDDPWRISLVRIGELSLTQRDLWVIGLSIVVLLIFFYVMQRTKVGIAMRASATDMEAALVQGINPQLIGPAAWLMSAGAAVIAGVMLSTEDGGGVVPSLDAIAFAALPALIIGGIRSLPGCVAGGMLLGVAQVYARGYAPEFLGQGFSSVVPWIVLILILMFRPGGLVSTREYRRA